MKKLLLGNEAVARGLYEAGCRVASSYPGTPSTEITEYAAKYEDIYCEWAPNEKVAMEVACGAAIAGARSFCAMKHVGLNVACDPLFTASYTGVNAGMVIAVADDPGMHSSQNEQDSRHHAQASKTMMLEPSDSAECLAYTKLAYELSEQFDTPVILRLSTRVSHSRSLSETAERVDNGVKDYVKDPQKYVMMPAMAKGRHVVVEERFQAETAWAETASINTVEYNDTSIGVIAAGISYQYAKEALGDRVSYLKLGCVYPLPVELIKEFADKCDTVYVIEQLDDFIETHCRKIGVDVIGKEAFSFCGEYSQAMIAKAIFSEEKKSLQADVAIPGRPPVLCAGCPHRGLFYALKKLKVTVSGDIGCYTLGALAPLGMIDTCICMGASVSALHGHNKAREGSNRHSVGRTMFTGAACPIMCGCCGTKRPTLGRCQTWKSWWRSSAPVRSVCACCISSLPNARPSTTRTRKPSSATWTVSCFSVAVRPAPSRKFPRTGWARLRSPCRPRGAPVGSPKVTVRTPNGWGGS